MRTRTVRRRRLPFTTGRKAAAAAVARPSRAEPSHATMGKIALQLKATLENVTNLRPLGEDFRWYLKMKCGNCGEISEKWQYIRLMDTVALKGGRGSASMVQKCKLCARENSIEILSSTIKSYNAEDNEKFKTIVEFECRGLEPIDFQPQAGFAAEGVESGTVFSDINLQEKVQDVGALQDTIGYLVGITISANKDDSTFFLFCFLLVILVFKWP
uniref:CXXC motif containing zinc binding protein n=1 Tax=Canis lupus familiaris TaxID=9615 RepID=A0A8P0TK39_CANLF